MTRRKTGLHHIAALLVVLLILNIASSIFSVSMTAHAYTPRTSAPATTNKYYYSSINPFYPNLGLPNCTCYAYGRAYELLGYDPKLPTKDAGKWYTTDTTHKKGSTPRLGAIACWKGTSSTYNGHVAVVEEINGNKISTSASNYGGDLFTYKKNYDPTTWCNSSPYNYTFQGYIYLDLPDSDTCENCVSITAGNYYLQNSSTKTYMKAASAADKAAISLAANTGANNFIFTPSGSKDAGYYLATKLNTNFVVNPYSDTPGDGTVINVYTKDTSGTQLWSFDKSGSGYIIHYKNNKNLCLTANGTSVKLATRTGAANQVWILEPDKQTVDVTFHRNLSSSDGMTAKESFTTGVSNQKFGYKTDGTGRYATMNDANVGFGGWLRTGYQMLGWSTEQNATTAMWKTYSGVEDAWIKKYAKSVDLYAVWEVIKPDWTPHSFQGSGTAEDPYQISNATELIEMQKLVNNSYYTSTYNKAYYIQTADIDLSGITWTPIGAPSGYTYYDNRFHGQYDGNQHVISNLYTDGSCVRGGLFGVVWSDTGCIKNLVVTGEVNANTTDSNVEIGGIVGSLQYGAQIEACAFIGTINSTIESAYVGGIAGVMWNGGSIVDCYQTGTITTNSQSAAGIVGIINMNKYIESRICTVQNCYHADGVITGKTVGGICGIVKRSDSMTNSVKITNCYVSSDAGGSVEVDGATANTALLLRASEMKNVADDLGNAFANHSNAKLNDGYPVFTWQLVVKGDVNEDGQFDVADVVLFQKWLLGIPNTNLANWEAADFSENGKLDAIDLSLMKRAIIGR